MQTDNELISTSAKDLLKAFVGSHREHLTPSLQRVVNDLGRPMRTTMGSELRELLLSIAEAVAAHPSEKDSPDQLEDRSRLYQELLVHGKTMGQRMPESW